MLQKLIIKNVALIDSVEINFTEGLNVLSGETGAGKSVIIESLNFVLGAKADKTLIRSTCNDCFVQAVFDVENNILAQKLFEEFDIDNDDCLILSRKLTIEGKNTVKINGSPATVGMLKAFTSVLVDVHGQSEHFHLLKNINQLNLIDNFASERVISLKKSINELVVQYKNLIKELDALGGDENQRLIRLDVLKYQISEIESCDLKEDEESTLLQIKQKLLYQERIITALNALKSCISDENGVSDILGGAEKMISGISEFSNEYSELYDRVCSLNAEIVDVSDTASSLLDSFDVDENDVNSVEERLETIKVLKKKYGNTYEDIITYLENSKTEVEKLENFSTLAENLLIRKQDLEEKLYKLYLDLTNERKKVAEVFSLNVINELHELGMPKSKFEVSFAEGPEFSECKFDSQNGIDNIEFLFSANSGEPLKPLSSVISGGEMSRFMLSIKAQTAKYNELSTFIFDEIDTGISGKIAKVVAEKFAKISTDVQIIAISHLPQISAMADNNLLIIKTETDNQTISTVKTLNSDEKILEIIRLIGGDINSASAMTHAKELIDTAIKYKETLKA